MDFYVCWSVDCESCRPEVNDTELGQRAIEGFLKLLEDVGWSGTLFLVPEEIQYMVELLGRKMETGHEIAMHLHPASSGFRSDYMGEYSYDEQIEIISRGLDTFKRLLGMQPTSVRTGFGSANDSTFPVLARLGLRQTSTSLPGRKMSAYASNWAGALLFAHYANPNNRFLEGGLDLVEFPLSVDWETMMWGGITPQDLRVEFTDAKNHGYLIRKIMQRQVKDKLPMKALLPFTHNIFDYSDRNNFRRETMQAMNNEIIIEGRNLGAALTGATLAEAGEAYRAAVPFTTGE